MTVHPTRPADVVRRTMLNAIARQLARAAIDLDADAVTRTARAAIDEDGVVSAWEQVFDPVRDHLESPDGSEMPGIAGQYFAQTLGRVLAAVPRPRHHARPAVLLCCADGEDDVLPVEAMAAAIGESGVTSCVLGARVPPAALAAASARLAPRIVVVWSPSRATAGPDQIAALVGAYAGGVVAAGQGWDATALPPPAVQPSEVSTALVLILAMLEASQVNGHRPRSGTGDRAGLAR